jgi:hypothetical protein
MILDSIEGVLAYHCADIRVYNGGCSVCVQWRVQRRVSVPFPVRFALHTSGISYREGVCL